MFAHSFVELQHPIYNKKGYPDSFWVESVSYFYGQNMSQSQVDLYKLYCDQTHVCDIPLWVSQYFSQTPDKSIKGKRSVADLQQELCSIHGVSSISELLRVNDVPEILSSPSTSKYFPKAMPPKKRRLQEVDDASILTTVYAPIAEATLRMLCNGEYQTLDAAARMKSHMDSTSKRPFLPTHDPGYDRDQLESVAANIARKVGHGYKYFQLTCGEALKFMPGISFCDGPASFVYAVDGFADGREVYFHGTSLQGLFGIVRSQVVNASEDGYVYAFRTLRLCIEKGYSVFEYIGNGLLVRSHCILKGNFLVKKGSNGPQMRIQTNPDICGYMLEVISSTVMVKMEGHVGYTIV